MVFLASDEPHSNVLQGIHCLPYYSFARASIILERNKKNQYLLQQITEILKFEKRQLQTCTVDAGKEPANSQRIIGCIDK